jgi:hypothetical protein
MGSRTQNFFFYQQPFSGTFTGSEVPLPPSVASRLKVSQNHSFSQPFDYEVLGVDSASVAAGRNG